MGSRTPRRRSTTGRDLIAFWEAAAENGLVPENSAQSLKSACIRVLSMYPDWQTLDITQIDVDGVLRAFTRANEGELSESTLQAYRSRFRRAVDDFLRDARGLSAWGQPRTSEEFQLVQERPEEEPQAEYERGTGVRAYVVTAGEDIRPSRSVSRAKRAEPAAFKYDLPLAGNRLARLNLPADLTHVDVDRIHSFLRTLPLDQGEPEPDHEDVGEEAP